MSRNKLYVIFATAVPQKDGTHPHRAGLLPDK